jgi:hypothetical protein
MVLDTQMHSAIITIEMPPNSYDTSVPQAWNNFIGEVDALRSAKPSPLEKQKGVLRLGENVWQVNMQENPSALARLINHADQFQLPYRILPLADVPQWLPVD